MGIDYSRQFSLAVSLAHHCLQSGQVQSAPGSESLPCQDYSPLQSETIRAHRLSRLVLEHLDNLGFEPVDIEDVRSDAVAHTRAALELVAATTLVSRALTDAGVAHLIFKGVVLGSLVSTVGGRGAGDVDVLVRQKDLGVVAGVLEGLGFRPMRALPPHSFRRSWSLWAFFDRECTYVGPPGQVDLHWRIAPQRQLMPSFEDFYVRRRDVFIGGTRVPTLGISDSLAAACFHAYHDRFEPLRGLIDIVRIVEASEGLVLPRYSRSLGRLIAGVLHLLLAVFPGVIDKPTAALLQQLPEPSKAAFSRWRFATVSPRVPWAEKADVGAQIEWGIAEARFDVWWEFFPRFIGKRLFLFPDAAPARQTTGLSQAFLGRLVFESRRILQRFCRGFAER
jgi:hypothetical protein